MDQLLEREIEPLTDEFLACFGDPQTVVALARRAHGESLIDEDSKRVERAQAAMSQLIDRLRPILQQHRWPRRWPVNPNLKIHVQSVLYGLLFNGRVAFQRECLEYAKEAFATGDARPYDVAVLTDVVLRSEGRPQRYGMVVTRSPVVEPEPIEDPERVDERRKSLGLPPLEEYLRERRANAEMYEREYQKLIGLHG